METVYLCARFQAVIPDWAADALLHTQRSLASGEFKDFNEAYGWDDESQSVRKRSARRAQIEKEVVGEMFRLRLDGASLGPGDMFDQVQDALATRGIQASRRDIEAIYKVRGKFIKNVPTSTDGNQVFAWADITLPLHRRTGRPILDDDEK